MLWYALRRLVLALPLLLGITFISFAVIHLAPGEPVDLQAGDLNAKSSAQARQLLREMYGLDKPLAVQYWNWLGWVPISGLRSLSWEYLSFWGRQWDFLSHLILPILVATFGGLAGFSRYMRQSMLEVVRQDYIQSARAKGLAEGVVIGKHALRNAMLPLVTILGLSLPGLIGGSVIVESIFAIPGMGQLMVQAVFERDYPVIMGNLVIVAVITLIANLLADVAYGLVDPLFCL